VGAGNGERGHFLAFLSRTSATFYRVHPRRSKKKMKKKKMKKKKKKAWPHNLTKRIVT
jgi:hypothetical protein